MSCIPTSDRESALDKLELTVKMAVGTLPTTHPDLAAVLDNIYDYSAIVGDELLTFTEYEDLGNNIYRLFNIYRNKLDIPLSDRHTSLGEIFISTRGMLEIPIDKSLEGYSLIAYASTKSNASNTSSYANVQISGVYNMPPPPTIYSVDVSLVSGYYEPTINISRRDWLSDDWEYNGSYQNTGGIINYAITAVSGDRVEHTERLATYKVEGSGDDVPTAYEYTYTGAMQLADFGGATDEVLFYIKPINYVYLNGIDTINKYGFPLYYIYQRNPTYLDTIQTDTVGNQLSDSTKVLTTTNCSYNITSGNYLSISSTDQADKGLKLDKKAVVRNSETLMLFRYDTSGTPSSAVERFGLIARGYAASGILITLNETMDTVSVYNMIDGTKTKLSYFSVALSATTDYYIRIHIYDSSIFVKLWAYGISEPAEWDTVVNHDESNFVGYMGIYQYGYNNDPYIAYLETEALST